MLKNASGHDLQIVQITTHLSIVLDNFYSYEVSI